MEKFFENYRSQINQYYINTEYNCSLLEVNSYKLPKSLLNCLIDYQLDGVNWLYNNYEIGLGCILADEMGLGKTIQAIALCTAVIEHDMILKGYSLCSLAEEKLNKSHLRKMSQEEKDKYITEYSRDAMKLVQTKILIIMPVTILYQWKEEFNKFYPLMFIYVHTALNKQIMHCNGIHLIGYECVRNNSNFFSKLDFSIIILDEGHKIKNCNTLTCIAIKCIYAKQKIILSGTPIQNSLSEFWCLIDFVHHGLLGTLPIFNKTFVTAINNGTNKFSTAAEKALANKALELLKKITYPHILRRTKADINQFTNIIKKEYIIYTKLTPIQYRVYSNYILNNYVALHQCTKLSNKSLAMKYFNILSIISNCPDLLFKYTSKIVIDKLYNYHYGDFSRCIKLEITLKLLKQFYNEKKRVVIFCQRYSYLDILEMYIKEFFNFSRIDGSITSYNKRMAIINNFNADKSIFVILMSIKVGSIGINLTGANRVIIYDPDWNPSTDLQAENRCYRIGQTDDVLIYRLISDIPFETYIYNTQLYKTMISNKLLSDQYEDEYMTSLKDLKIALGQPKKHQAYDKIRIDQNLFKIYQSGIENKLSSNLISNEFELNLTGVLLDNSKALFDKESTSSLNLSIGKYCNDNFRINTVENQIKEILEKKVIENNDLYISDEEEGKFTSEEIQAYDSNSKYNSDILKLDKDGVINNSEIDVISSLINNHKINIEKYNQNYILENDKTINNSTADVESIYNMLKSSEIECKAWKNNVPTWTGSCGVAGRPVETIKQVKKLEIDIQIKAKYNDVIDSLKIDDSLLPIFCKLVKTLRNAEVDLCTGEIVQLFGPYLENNQANARFKTILNKICDKFDTTPITWRLKSNYLR